MYLVQLSTRAVVSWGALEARTSTSKMAHSWLGWLCFSQAIGRRFPSFAMQTFYEAFREMATRCPSKLIVQLGKAEGREVYKTLHSVFSTLAMKVGSSQCRRRRSEEPKLKPGRCILVKFFTIIQFLVFTIIQFLVTDLLKKNVLYEQLLHPLSR